MTNISVFNIADDWCAFVEKMEQYLILQDFTTATHWPKKLSYLVTHLSDNVYKLLKNLCAPASPVSKSFADLVEILNTQFVPKTLIYKERKGFYKPTHDEDESDPDTNFILKSNKYII
jgi:hypothetical protein